jgi:chemotaxis protein MotB
MILKKIKSHYLDTAGTDRYLITYADLITLLLGLFVILYATAQVDSSKFKMFSSAFSEYFKVKDDKILQGGDGVLEGHKMGVPTAILPPVAQRTVEDFIEQSESVLQQFFVEGRITMRREETGVILVLAENLLFASAKAEIQPAGEAMLDSLATILRGLDFEISVDGHTDADPIRTFQFESNWHLSVARATNIAYSLISKGIPEHNVVIRGFGSQRPLDENITREGKAKNRRVEIGINEKTYNMAKESELEENND